MEETRPMELKRDLGPWTAAAIVVGTVIGSGIFLVPRTMVQGVGTAELVAVVWVVGGLLSLAGALSYAELAAAIPEAGGEYAYLREAYGPMWGFLYSWTQMWVAKSGSIATLATGFFYYLTTFFPALDRVIYSIPLPIGPHGGPLEIRSEFKPQCSHHHVARRPGVRRCRDRLPLELAAHLRRWAYHRPRGIDRNVMMRALRLK